MEMRFVWLLALAFVGMSAAAHSQSRIKSSMDLAVNSGEGKGALHLGIIVGTRATRVQNERGEILTLVPRMFGLRLR